jgi:predicted nucleic acid-binding protein
MITSSAAVIDSGLVILNVIDTPQSEMASQVLKGLQRARTDLSAPHLWYYKVTSVIHGYLYEEILDPHEAEQALQTALDFSISLVKEDDALCCFAFYWANRLMQKATYDSFYIALAERLGVVLWTADQRLANNAKQNGISWVRWIGD